MKRSKTIKISLIVIVVVLFYYFAPRLLVPGSYPFAERYTIESSEDSVKVAIDRFFDQNPQYKLPEDSYLARSQCQKNGYWYHVYFYDYNTNGIIKTWIRDWDSVTTTMALVAITNGPNRGDWATVNGNWWDKGSLSCKENGAVKKEFEEQILDKIKKEITINNANK